MQSRTGTESFGTDAASGSGTSS